MYLSASLLTYNGAAYIKKQLDSILHQTQQVDEIVICDDGSTDATIEIIQGYQQQYPGIIQLHQNPIQLGSTKNMEKCLGLTKGAVVFLADQDDIWLPNKVATMLRYFNAHPETSAVFSNASLINAQDEPITGMDLWDIIGFPETALPTDLNLFDYLCRVDNMVTGAGLAIRDVKTLLQYPFPNQQGLLHDGWIALYYASQGKLSYCQEKLYQYRIHPAQQMGGNTTHPRLLLAMNLALYKGYSPVANFTSLKAYWNRIEQNIRVQKGLSSLYQQMSIDHERILSQLNVQLNELYKKGESTYPIRTMLRRIKKAISR